MIDIIRLHTREYPILEILYHTPQADVVVTVHTYNHHLNTDMFITGNDIDTLALAMTYRTRLVARTRSTAKQLFPVFHRLRRYVAAINNTIDDKLSLRAYVTKSQLKDRESRHGQSIFYRGSLYCARMHIREIRRLPDSLNSQKTRTQTAERASSKS